MKLNLPPQRKIALIRRAVLGPANGIGSGGKTNNFKSVLWLFDFKYFSFSYMIFRTTIKDLQVFNPDAKLDSFFRALWPQGTEGTSAYSDFLFFFLRHYENNKISHLQSLQPFAARDAPSRGCLISRFKL